MGTAVAAAALPERLTVASFLRLPEDRLCWAHVIGRRALVVSESLYKWRERLPTARRPGRRRIYETAKTSFDASDGTYGLLRGLTDLLEDGWKVSKKTVAGSMAANCLHGRPKKRRRSLMRPKLRLRSLTGRAGLHRRANLWEVVLGPAVDPHRLGQVVPGHRGRPFVSFSW